MTTQHHGEDWIHGMWQLLILITLTYSRSR